MPFIEDKFLIALVVNLYGLRLTKLVIRNYVAMKTRCFIHQVKNGNIQELPLN